MNDIKSDEDLAREIADLLSLDTDLRERGIDVRVDPEWRSSRLVDEREG